MGFKTVFFFATVLLIAAKYCNVEDFCHRLHRFSQKFYYRISLIKNLPVDFADGAEKPVTKPYFNNFFTYLKPSSLFICK
jgi:hypothetical protein